MYDEIKNGFFVIFYSVFHIPRCVSCLHVWRDLPRCSCCCGRGAKRGKHNDLACTSLFILPNTSCWSMACAGLAGKACSPYFQQVRFRLPLALLEPDFVREIKHIKLAYSMQLLSHLTKVPNRSYSCSYNNRAGKVSTHGVKTEWEYSRLPVIISHFPRLLTHFLE